MQRYAYKSVGAGTLHLHVSPPNRPHADGVPTAVFYHGGGWVRGSWEQFRPQAERVNAHGMLAVLVEYRLDGPIAATADAIDAMDAVFDHADDVGCDPTRVAAVGGSTGAHLALATCLLRPADVDSARRPAALVLLNPVTNTCGEFPVGFGRRHFGADRDALQYSPVHHLAEHVPPMIVMHGTNDSAVHHHNSVAFVEAVRGRGGRADLILFPGRRHGFFNRRTVRGDPSGGDADDFEETTQQMVRFLGEVLAPAR